MLFWKMNGLGNDYIFIDVAKQSKDEIIILERNLKSIIPAICDRHFGIGGDGIVFMYPSSVSDVEMRMYNADGSEGKTCGNALRCIAKYLVDTQMCHGDMVTISTRVGIMKINVEIVNGNFKSACVDMGVPSITRANSNAIYVDIGNLHAVTLSELLDDTAMAKAQTLSSECDINVEVVKIISLHAIQMRVCERGSGETLACGTGASAAAYALIMRGILQSPVSVLMRGGELTIEYLDGHVYMIGKADLNYIGEMNISDYGQD